MKTQHSQKLIFLIFNTHTHNILQQNEGKTIDENPAVSH